MMHKQAVKTCLSAGRKPQAMNICTMMR